MRTNFDPPADPENIRACRNCDQPLANDWLSHEWACENPDCKDSPYFVPFLNVPKDAAEFRYVNEGEKDVTIRYFERGSSYEEITFLRMTKAYGWFIFGEDDDEGSNWEMPENAPRMFETIAQTISDARQFIEQFPDSDNEVKRNALRLLEAFEKVN